MRLFDTDAVIESLQTGELEPGAISTITLMELLRGVRDVKRGDAKRLIEETFTVLPIDNETILAYCTLYDDLKGRGELIPDSDLMIAATAMVRDTSLRSRDNHFKRLESHGLKLEGG
jgi:hypothetical protein